MVLLKSKGMKKPHLSHVFKTVKVIHFLWQGEYATYQRKVMSTKEL